MHRAAGVLVLWLPFVVGAGIGAADEATLGRFRAEYPPAAAKWKTLLNAMECAADLRLGSQPSKQVQYARLGDSLLVNARETVAGAERTAADLEVVRCWTPTHAFELERQGQSPYVLRAAVTVSESPQELERAGDMRLVHAPYLLAPIMLFDLPLPSLLVDPGCTFLDARAVKHGATQAVLVSFTLSGSGHWYTKGTATLLPDRDWAIAGYELTHRADPGETHTDIYVGSITYQDFAPGCFPGEITVQRKTIGAGRVQELRHLGTSRFRSVTTSCDPEKLQLSHFGLPDLPKFEPRSVGSWQWPLVAVGACLLATSGACRWAARKRHASRGTR
jgi:hypothetical protein